MRKSIRIFTASSLIAVFGLFTVGLPVVRYLCPMMNDEESSCPYTMQTKNPGTGYANETPSCCVSYIVAERSTTPYTSVEKYSAQPLHVQSFAVVDCVTGFGAISATRVGCVSDDSPPPAREPIFILNNSILI